MIRTFLRLFNDPRVLQLSILGSLLVYGLVALNWSAELWRWTAFAIPALLTQWMGNQLTGARGYKSAWITIFGLCLLLYASSWWVAALCAILSIGVKFVIRADGKHFFNPSNFGIVVVILLTGEAWISPGQWGSGAFWIFAIGGGAMLTTIKVKRLSTAIAFIATLFFLESIRTVFYLGWGFDVLVHQFASGALLLFTFFMITDPVTTPRHHVARIVWAAGVAVLAFALTHWVYLYTAPIYALIILSPLTPLINRWFPAEKFLWNSTQIQFKPQTLIS